MTLSVEDYLENEAVVQVDWKLNLLTENYSVYLSSTDHSNVTTTSNNSIRVMLLYNNEYNFSLVGNNCKGSNTLFSTTFMVGKWIPIMLSVWKTSTILKECVESIHSKSMHVQTLQCIMWYTATTHVVCQLFCTMACSLAPNLQTQCAPVVCRCRFAVYPSLSRM